jgi:hypothetical protein
MKKEFYLASFPKSGNTWINFTLANVYNQLCGEFEEIDFFNIHDINPELNEGEEKKPLFMDLDLPWIFMTHSVYKKAFDNVILIMRNPRDVLYSYYFYLRGERKKQISLPEIIVHNKYGIKSIIKHNQSFIMNCHNLLIITYENMHCRPKKEVKKILDFLDLNVDNKIIDTSIKKSSFKNMRRIELKKGRKYGTPGFLFTRRGKVGEGKRAISKYKELDRYISNEIKRSPLLHLLYE